MTTNGRGSGLLYLTEADVGLACREVDPLACVSQALAAHAAGDVDLPDEAVLRWEPSGGGAARTLNMPGLIDGPVPVIGTKIINASVQNPASGLPRASGLTLLFNPVTARPEAILQAASISALRTAAVSTLAALHLQPDAPQVLGVIGAGPIARAHILLMTEHLPITRVLVCDRVDDRAQSLVRGIRDVCPGAPEVDDVADPKAVVQAADIVVTATTTTTAYIGYDWLKPGAVVVNVSLDDLEEEAYLRADRLYVDDWDLVVGDTQRLLGRLARAGKVTAPGHDGGRPVDGTLGELVTGACPGRDDDGQIMVVNPFGMAICDLAIASRVHEVALLRNYGVLLET